MTDILVINGSKLLTATDIEPVIAAINKQVAGDFAPYWGVAGTLHFGDAPAGAWRFLLQDTIDQAGDLGYHVDENGIVSAIIDVAACKASGSDWRTCLSHEAHEALVDPLCTRMSPDGSTIVETDDPVEEDSYPVDGVPISNFVTPAYFGFNADTRTDKMGLLNGGRAPTLRPGGYLEMLVNGVWTTKLGERAAVRPGYMAMRLTGRRAWRKAQMSGAGA